MIWSIFAHAELDQPDRAKQLFTMINPINHARASEDLQTYGVEPYVIAADDYSLAPHVGRGGWTWYTGSAGWFYRAGLEAILGVTRRGDEIHVKPCIPADWDELMVAIRIDPTWYDIQVLRRPLHKDEHEAKVKMVKEGHFMFLHDNSATRLKIVLSLAADSNESSSANANKKLKRIGLT